jgi:hypothetical protein
MADVLALLMVALIATAGLTVLSIVTRASRRHADSFRRDMQETDQTTDPRDRDRGDR